MTDAHHEPAASSDKLAFFCSQLLDDELSPEDLERFLQHKEHQASQQLHRYALIRQHLQATHRSSLNCSIDLSARVQSALDLNCANDLPDEPTTNSTTNQSLASRPIATQAKVSAQALRKRVPKPYVFACSGIAAAVSFVLLLPWINQDQSLSVSTISKTVTTAAPLQVAVNTTDTSVRNDLVQTSIDPELLGQISRPVTVQELNDDVMASMRSDAYAELAETQRTQFNEFYRMHVGYGEGYTQNVRLAYTTDSGFNPNLSRAPNITLVNPLPSSSY